MMKISLKVARINAELTHDEVAWRMGVSTSRIRNWENGYPINENQKEQLAKNYNIPKDMLVFPDGKRRNYSEIR